KRQSRSTDVHLSRKTDESKQFFGFPPHIGLRAAITSPVAHPAKQSVVVVAIKTHHYVFDRAHIAEQFGVLKRTGNSFSGDRMSRTTVNPFLPEQDGSVVWVAKPCNDVE